MIDEAIKIVFATTVPGEQSEFARHIRTRGLAFDVFVPDGQSSLDSLIREHAIDIVVTDLHFQGGAFAEWLFLWPIPFILLAGQGDLEGIEALVKDESSGFLMRQDGQAHLAVLPAMIRKVLNSRESIMRQNQHLLLSERQYYDLVQALPDIVYRLDAQGRFTFVNDSVRGLGWRSTDLVGRHFSAILHPEDLPRISRREVLAAYRGRTTGDAGAPGLFDERRSFDRRTRGLEIRLRRKNDPPGQPDMQGTVTAFGEMISADFRESSSSGGEPGSVGIIRDITERKQADLEREGLIDELRRALADVKTLSGFIPICASCKKIRDDKGYWNQVEEYIAERSDALFSHGLCPDCLKKFNPDLR